jgi:protein SCO1/2
MSYNRRVIAPLLVGGLLALAACGGRGADKGEEFAVTSGFRGVLTDPPREKPDFTLTDFNGAPFNFREQTAGKVTLLFEARDAIRFIFVTTDPSRDTPERLKEWLGAFDPTFIGLRGTEEEVNRILFTMRMPPIQKDPAAASSTEYLVGHAAQVLAFGIDGKSRLEYPFGIRQEDWAQDLPKLARGEMPTGVQPSGPGAVDLKPLGERAAVPTVPIRVAAALVPQPASSTEGALYLVLRNGSTDDTLVSVSSEAVQSAELHETMPGDHQKMGHMMPVKEVVVRAGETLQFTPGGRHVMLMGFTKRPEIGETIPVRLRFKQAGEVVLAANVVSYADLERMLAAAVTSLGQ